MNDDIISRAAAIDTIEKSRRENPHEDSKEARFHEYEHRHFLKILHDLPPAQPEPIRINLNEYIKVKLTDLGKEIYYHQYDRLNQCVGREICKPMFPKEDENGYTEFQLWCFIELYGEYIGITMPNVIEPLEIVYEG